MRRVFNRGLADRSTRRGKVSGRLFLEWLEDRALMAVFASTRSGLWTDETVWGFTAGSGKYPKAGDVATINAGQVVTAATDAEVGTSAASGSHALTVLGQLVVNAGVNLVVKGDILASGRAGTNGQIRVSGQLIMDGTAASARYKVTVGAEHGTTAKLVFAGSSTSPAGFLSRGNGSTNAYVSGGSTWIGGGQIDADYTNFTRIGDATTNLTTAWPSEFAPNSNFLLRNSTFDACGKISLFTAIWSGSNLDVSNSRWVNSPASVNLRIAAPEVPATTNVLRRVFNNRFDKPVEFYTVNGLNVDQNQFGGGYLLTGYRPASWSYNLVHSSNTAGNQGVATATNNYYFNDVDINPHPFNIGQEMNYDLSGFIFDSVIGEVGDMIVGGPRAGNYAIKVTNSIVLPNAAGNSPGELVSPLAPGATWTVDHNTVTSTSAQSANAETGVGVYGETYHGNPGMYASLRSNLVYSPTGKGAFLLRHAHGDVSDPLVSPAMGNYNGANVPVTTVGDGVRAVYGAKGGYIDVATYDLTAPMFTSTEGLGANDVVAEPNFLDFSRNLATFDTAYLKNVAPGWVSGQAYRAGDIVSAASLGFYQNANVNFRCVVDHVSDAASATMGKPGVATNWSTRWELASSYRIRSVSAVYTPGTPQATPRDLYEWVKAGAAPTNPAFKGAAHDAGDIGAVAVVLAPQAQPQSVVVAQDGSAAVTLVAVDPNVTGGISSLSASLVYSITTAPTRGQLSGIAPNLVYTPTPGTFGPDQFRFTVTNSQGLSSSALVSIQVVGKPTATGQTVSMNQGQSLSLTLTGVDPNSPALPLSYMITTAPSSGQLSGVAPNLTYTPSPTFVGTDTFQFVVSNGVVTSTVATVSIAVVAEAAPQVSDVQVGFGSRWTSVLGLNRTLPWLNIDALRIVFSTDVRLPQSSLSLTGINRPSYSTSAFSYDASARAATWGLASSLDVDRIRLNLDGDSAQAVQTPLGTKLGGGQDFLLNLNVLPGDVNGDGVVNAVDVNIIKNDLAGIAIASIFDDLDGDGVITANDYNEARRRSGRRLPTLG